MEETMPTGRRKGAAVSFQVDERLDSDQKANLQGELEVLEKMLWELETETERLSWQQTPQKQKSAGFRRVESVEEREFESQKEDEEEVVVDLEEVGEGDEEARLGDVCYKSLEIGLDLARKMESLSKELESERRLREDRDLKIELLEQEVRSTQAKCNYLEAKYQSVASQVDGMLFILRLMARYEPPEWGVNGRNVFGIYLEVIKNGVVKEKLTLPLTTDSSCVVAGRMETQCDLVLAHPSISRVHGALQFDEQGALFLCDLRSTHGCYVNKKRVKAEDFVRLHIGDVLCFGESTRLYAVCGPAELLPAEYDSLNLTKFREKLDKKKELREKKKQEEERGASWGFGEDAEEESEEEEEEEQDQDKNKEQLPDYLRNLKEDDQPYKSSTNIKKLESELAEIEKELTVAPLVQQMKELDRSGELLALCYRQQWEKAADLLQEENVTATTVASALHQAVVDHREETLLFLLEKARPELLQINTSLQKDGRTLLHLALDGGNLRVIRALLVAGADVVVPDKKSVKPMDLMTWTATMHPTIMVPLQDDLLHLQQRNALQHVRTQVLDEVTASVETNVQNLNARAHEIEEDVTAARNFREEVNAQITRAQDADRELCVHIQAEEQKLQWVHGEIGRLHMQNASADQEVARIADETQKLVAASAALRGMHERQQQARADVAGQIAIKLETVGLSMKSEVPSGTFDEICCATSDVFKYLMAAPHVTDVGMIELRECLSAATQQLLEIQSEVRVTG
ncbi:hypothetical protein BBO99_00006454 [Phytophthora kernoviae]|uniref:FHA domain-containing protein n=2 Tax=Phytophthora kernoviae TaxID=325452 RepID=A0A3R7J9J7_9STRA|nr:hypothetical protein G195_003568 [Phytophthora kernoviae 00238/432]KAG2522286.1 hypothetical protein JM16_002226 [Phytophthora kernoviae]KAG2522874.1 hypothetical protein JM18_003946 [Phytophthora kernoviae]RLN44178.1 hypothetical protein BBI17_002631 [Phytophthora kernoviae]RLN77807.1 hypothetical protein BBO99_00006454 [Phytophthora kernoviae]